MPVPVPVVVSVPVLVPVPVPVPPVPVASAVSLSLPPPPQPNRAATPSEPRAFSARRRLAGGAVRVSMDFSCKWVWHALCRPNEEKYGSAGRARVDY